MRTIKLLIIATLMVGMLPLALGEQVALQDYARPGQLAPLPNGMASLYRVPWRSNARTASAYDALQGAGVYYKHVPAWSIEQNTHIMQQMAACGVRHMRVAPHLAMYINKDWTAPKPEELKTLLSEMTACKNAAIRPCVVFVHLPPFGSEEALKTYVENQKPWKRDWMPQGPIGSPEYSAYLDKVWLAMEFILKTARDAGFKNSDSYDLEMGQNLWWGFPAMKPNPALTLKDLQPGGIVYEFDKALMEKARNAGYREPTFLWSQCHHYFEHMNDAEVPPGAAGRAISIYSQYAGTTGTNAFTGSDEWPRRAPLKFYEGSPPRVVLAKPEGWMADFSRRDCIIPLLRSSKTPIAFTSLGVVPADIPGAMVEKQVGNRTVKVKAEAADGWLLKTKGINRSLAFWLNQGVSFILIHSAYEHKNDEMSHALIPYIGEVPKDPEELPNFTWQMSKPLTALKAFTDSMAGAKKLPRLTDLNFEFALGEDAELIPASERGGPLKASDALALLPFQINEKKFALAAYIVTPTITVPLKPTEIRVLVDKRLDDEILTVHTLTGAKGKATVLQTTKDSTAFSLDIDDSVTMVVFGIK